MLPARTGRAGIDCRASISYRGWCDPALLGGVIELGAYAGIRPTTPSDDHGGRPYSSIKSGPRKRIGQARGGTELFVARTPDGRHQMVKDASAGSWSCTDRSGSPRSRLACDFERGSCEGSISDEF